MTPRVAPGLSPVDVAAVFAPVQVNEGAVPMQQQKPNFFSDVQLVIIGQLRQDHADEVARLRDEVKRLGTTIDDLVHICELNDVAICRCQSCKRLGSEQETYNCEGCAMTLCEACNAHAGHIGIDGDNVERCLECSIMAQE